MPLVRCAFLLVATLVACRNPDGVAPLATVSFSLDAPLCSSRIAAHFLIDGQQVGVDTFRIHLAPDHTVSQHFLIAPGTHTLGARVSFGGVAYMWPEAPDTVVVLRAGSVFTRVLPFYCS